MDQAIEKHIEDLENRAKKVRRLANVAITAGFFGIPLAFILLIADQKWPGICVICWSVGHFVGYMAKCMQEQKIQIHNRLCIAEEVAKTASKESSQPNQSTARFVNRISLN